MEEKKRLWVQTRMDPCFYKMALCYVASTAEVWYKLDLLQHPRPLPLPWSAPYPCLPRRRPGEVPSAHTGQKGQAPAFVRTRLLLTGEVPR